MEDKDLTKKTDTNHIVSFSSLLMDLSSNLERNNSILSSFASLNKDSNSFPPFFLLLFYFLFQ